MSHRVRAWLAAAAAVLALTAVPAVVVTIQTPGFSRAEDRAVIARAAVVLFSRIADS